MTLGHFSASLLAVATAALLGACAQNKTSAPAAPTPAPAAAPSPAPVAPSTATAKPMAEDPYIWLEDVEGAKPLAWVRERNAATRQVLEAQPSFKPTRDALLAMMDSSARIPAVTRDGNYFYNLWKDKDHPRGLYRRTTLDEYRKADPKWDVLLDLDALAKAENENWVWGGIDCLPRSSRCLLSLSRGGADAQVTREWDREKRAFVAGGFTFPEAKSRSSWLDENTLLFGTDQGPGSMTDSGYPRIVKLWKRGQPMGEAQTIFEGQQTDTWVEGHVDHTPGYERVVLLRGPSFFESIYALWAKDASGQRKVVPIDVPTHVKLAFLRDQMMMELRDDWTVGGKTYKKGSLLSANADAYMKGERQFHVVFEPTATRSLDGWSATKSQVLMWVMDNVTSQGYAAKWDGKAWSQRALKLPSPGSLSLSALHDPFVKNDPLAEAYFVNYSDFLTPQTLYMGSTANDKLDKLKSLPAFFNAEGMRVEQQFATSKDGTKVPYYIVWPKGATANGKNPTLLYGYGGFEISMNPGYAASQGIGWLNQGGVYVLSNIRGGGEFGPAWHQSAQKENKQRSYDDFIAIAEDLIARKVTAPRHLGIMGGSNGGLLMGAITTQRPDLFNAVVCQVPLLDMRRFHTLLAGASWMGEYGNPDDPAQWAYISKYSPYQNVRKDVKYPEVFFITSTRDDRVHPGHARKMAARMSEMGHKVYYYENIEGGHGGAANNEQRADMRALEFAYLWMKLK